jgi:hypothetical protein
MYRNPLSEEALEAINNLSEVVVEKKKKKKTRRRKYVMMAKTRTPRRRSRPHPLMLPLGQLEESVVAGNLIMILQPFILLSSHLLALMASTFCCLSVFLLLLVYSWVVSPKYLCLWLVSC